MAIAVAVISMYVQHSSVSLRKIVWEFPGRKQWSGSEGMLAASSHLGTWKLTFLLTMSPDREPSIKESVIKFILVPTNQSLPNG